MCFYNYRCHRPRCGCAVRVPIYIPSPFPPFPPPPPLPPLPPFPPQPTPFGKIAYGGFYSIGDATIALVANVPQVISLNTVSMPHKNVISGGNYLQVSQSGDYLLCYTVSTSVLVSNAFVTFYVTQNGAEIPSSRTSANLIAGQAQVFSSESIVHLNAGDILALNVVSDTSVNEYIVSGGAKLMVEKISE